MLISALGKGEAKSSILFGSTIFFLTCQRLSLRRGIANSAPVGGTLLEHTSGAMENPWTDVANLFRGKPLANKLHDELGFDAAAFMDIPPSTSWNYGEDTWLYLMACSDTIFKVGIAANVERRRIALQASCPIPIYVVRTVHYNSRLYALLAERTAHGLLANSRLHGEWFHCERRHVGKVISLVKSEMPKLIRKHELARKMRQEEEQFRYETDAEYREAIDRQRRQAEEQWQRYRAKALGEPEPAESAQS